MTRRQMRVNFLAEVKIIIEDYKNHGMGLLHALQKDNIQNSYGAKEFKKGNNFAVHIELIAENGFSAVTFTDSGTKGLTGTKYINLDDVADTLNFDNEEERLANFETHKNLGAFSNRETGGFVGQGKLVSNIHSENFQVYFDSRRDDDNEYLIGSRHFDPPNLDGNNMDIILGNITWNTEAKKEIHKISNGVLKSLEISGTRIIIMNPKEELKEYIKSGKMMEDIQDTWWEVIRNNRINGIYVKHSGEEKKAQFTKFFAEAYEPDDEKIMLNSQEISSFGRTGKMVFGFANEDLPPHLNGITVQRERMPIVQANELYDHFIHLDIPSSHRKRFYGIVLLDKNLESQMRRYEKKSHYGLERPAKGAQLYDAFRNHLNDNGIEPLKVLHGLSDRGGDSRRVDRETTKNACRDINELFAKNGITGGPGGRLRTHFIVAHKKSTGLKEMNFLGETVKPTFEIKNRTDENHTALVNMRVFDEENTLIETLIETENVQLNNNGNTSLPEQVIVLGAPNYQNGMIYRVVCQAEIDGKQYSGDLKIYVNRVRETNMKDFVLSPIIEEWPQPPTSRIDTDEVLKGVTCTIASKILDPVKTYLDVRLYNAADRQRLDGQHYQSGPFELEANGTVDIEYIDDVVFNEDTTEGIGSGTIWLRFTLRAAEATGSNKPGDELAHSQIIVYFNCDHPGAGIFEQYNPGPLGAGGPLALVDPTDTGGYICTINNDHPNYKEIFDTDNQRLKDNYTRDVLIRQGLLTCVKYHTDVNLMLRIFDITSLDHLSPTDINTMVENAHGRLLNDALRNN